MVRLVGGVGTLLGPEGTNHLVAVAAVGVFFWIAQTFDSHALVAGPCPDGCWPSRGGCGCAFVENCIVDASIFVVKLLRAHGGCLGTRSR